MNKEFPSLIAPSAQDPLVEQARFLNESDWLERKLAARKALRPDRSKSARKGWETRRG